jgi:hypothetical protein
VGFDGKGSRDTLPRWSALWGWSHYLLEETGEGNAFLLGKGGVGLGKAQAGTST